MEDGDIALQVCAGISLFLAAAVVTIACARNRCKQDKLPSMKQSPSMEELNTIGLEDPSTNA